MMRMGHDGNLISLNFLTVAKITILLFSSLTSLILMDTPTKDEIDQIFKKLKYVPGNKVRTVFRILKASRQLLNQILHEKHFDT